MFLDIEYTKEVVKLFPEWVATFTGICTVGKITNITKIKLENEELVVKTLKESKLSFLKVV
jgi:hypothetical protein